MIDKPYTARVTLGGSWRCPVFWSVCNMIPPALFIFYCYNKGHCSRTSAPSA